MADSNDQVQNQQTRPVPTEQDPPPPSPGSDKHDQYLMDSGYKTDNESLILGDQGDGTVFGIGNKAGELNN